MENNAEIESFRQLSDENPYPVLRIYKDGQLLYFNRASIPLLTIADGDSDYTLSPELRQLTQDGFEHQTSKMLELEYSGRIFSITLIPCIEQDYANVYGHDVSTRKITEDYLIEQNKILGSLVTGKPLQEILDGLSRSVEKHSSGLMNSILIMHQSKRFLRYGSAPSLPKDYLEKTKKVLMGPKEGSCGTAAFLKEMVVVEDIAHDPRWEKYKAVPLKFGLRACWSAPILDCEGEVLGTFASYYTEPRKPTTEEIKLIKTSANFAALAIQNYNAQNELKNYAEELKRSNNDLRDFTQIASHDLQEPLRKISIFSDRLKSSKAYLNEQQLDDLDKMRNAAERMQTLIDDLLQFSQINSTGIPFRKVDLEEIASEVIEDLEVQINETRGEVKQADLPTIEADPFQMRQLFQNLIGNALKYHQPKTSPVIFLSSESIKNGSYSISVQDNGIGLDTKFSEKIFMPLERLHGRNSYDGSGIGLAICKKIVSRHNGKISVTSKIGEGSKFTIILPKRQPTSS